MFFSRIKITLLMAVLISCTAIQYIDDTGFLNSSQANSFEALVKIGGKACKDMDGRVGLCVKQIESNRSLKIFMPPMPYDYTLIIKCTMDLDQSRGYDVEKGKEFNLAISDYKGMKSFQCIGEIFPQDREEEISAKWGILVKVVDPNYQPRTAIYKTGDYLITGKHSRYVRYCYSDGKCKNKKKKTMIKNKNNEVVSVFSESKTMRFNYYGF
jgi:hypothetical protein